MSDHGQIEDTFLEKSETFFLGCVLVFFWDSTGTMEKAWLGLERSEDLSEGVDETWPLCGPRLPVWWVEFRAGCSVGRKLSDLLLSPEEVSVGEMLESQSLN